MLDVGRPPTKRRTFRAEVSRFSVGSMPETIPLCRRAAPGDGDTWMILREGSGTHLSARMTYATPPHSVLALPACAYSIAADRETCYTARSVSRPCLSVPSKRS
jgi:hypothetical protein